MSQLTILLTVYPAVLVKIVAVHHVNVICLLNEKIHCLVRRHNIV